MEINLINMLYVVSLITDRYVLLNDNKCKENADIINSEIKDQFIDCMSFIYNDNTNPEFKFVYSKTILNLLEMVESTDRAEEVNDLIKKFKAIKEEYNYNIQAHDVGFSYFETNLRMVIKKDVWSSKTPFDYQRFFDLDFRIFMALSAGPARDPLCYLDKFADREKLSSVARVVNCYSNFVQIDDDLKSAMLKLLDGITKEEYKDIADRLKCMLQGEEYIEEMPKQRKRFNFLNRNK